MTYTVYDIRDMFANILLLLIAKFSCWNKMQISNCRFNCNVGSDEETSNNGYSEHPTVYPRRKQPKYLFKL